ncbi:MAG: NUDIX domain-containing protein [Pseudomonadota bacterium]
MTQEALETDVTVAAIAERDGRYLCIEEMSSRGLAVSLPGGHIEAGETPEQAIVREVLEETRYDFAVTGFIGAYLWLDLHRNKRKLQLVYCGDAPGIPDGLALDAGILSVHWRDRAALETEAHRLRSPLMLAALDDYTRGKREQLVVEPGLDAAGLARRFERKAQRI